LEGIGEAVRDRHRVFPRRLGRLGERNVVGRVGHCLGKGEAHAAILERVLIRRLAVVPMGKRLSMSAVSKAVYMPLQIGTSVAGGLLAGRIFTEIWQRISPSDQEPPDPKDLDRPGREAIAAARLQGLVFGVVRAAVSPAGAAGCRACPPGGPG